MVEIKENDSILKACGYCLKVFETKNEDKIGCNSCEIKVDRLIRQGTLLPFVPKTLEERIKELEKKIK